MEIQLWREILAPYRLAVDELVMKFNHIKKEYQDVPIGTIIAVLSALIYFVSPIDLVPDSIPAIGYFDDAAVVAACWKLVESDIDEYLKWRKEHRKDIIEKISKVDSNKVLIFKNRKSLNKWYYKEFNEKIKI